MRLLSFLLFPALMMAADLTVDHVTAAGPDLKAMQAALAAAGIRSEYGGRHNNRATEMALASFPDGSYLELIAIQPDADPPSLKQHYWSKHLRGNAGATAWAVRAPDLPTELERLHAAGIETGKPGRSGRTRADGVKLEWESATVGPGPNGTSFPFLIRDFSPREARAYPSGKPTTTEFRGVRRVVIAVRDLKAGVALYRRAYALPAPAEQADASFEAKLAGFAGTPIILAAPAGANSWLAKRLEEFGEGPCAFLLQGTGTANGKTAGQAQWFGARVSWFDHAKLGWRLGVER